MKSAIGNILDWFFAEGDTRCFTVVRTAFFSTFLFLFWDLYPSLDFLLGEKGIYGTKHLAFLTLGRFDLNLLFYHCTHSDLQIWFWSSVAAAFLGLIGICPRLMTLLVLLAHSLMWQRNPHIMYGADFVLRYIGVWILFMGTGKKRVSLWPLKAIQIQMAIIYLYAACHKFSSHSWAEGSALFYALQSSSSLAAPLFKSLVLDHPLLATMFDYYTLVAEFAFAFLVFTPFRRLALISVILLHVGIDLFMMIRLFAPAMYCGLLAFVTPREWDWLGKKVSQTARRLSDFCPSVSEIISVLR